MTGGGWLSPLPLPPPPPSPLPNLEVQYHRGKILERDKFDVDKFGSTASYQIFPSILRMRCVKGQPPSRGHQEITAAIHQEATARDLIPKFSFISQDQFQPPPPLILALPKNNPQIIPPVVTERNPSPLVPMYACQATNRSQFMGAIRVQRCCEGGHRGLPLPGIIKCSGAMKETGLSSRSHNTKSGPVSCCCKVSCCLPLAYNASAISKEGFSPGFCLVSVLPYPGGGGWVGLAEFQGGWVSNPPPPPGWGGTLWGPLGLSSQCHFFLSSVAGSV